ncbi:MAG: hypothetical protein WCD70_03435 [Alphaproteobacteria bacterium]
MRLSHLAVVGLMLIALPALAQQSTPVPASPDSVQQGKPSFGSRTCADIIPCVDSAEAISVDPGKWAAWANSCVTSAFGYSSTTGFVNTAAGLDSSGCLTTIQGSIPKGLGAQLSAKCCVLALPNNTCAMHCDLQQQ